MTQTSQRLYDDIQRAALASRDGGDEAFERLYRLAAPPVRGLLRRVPAVDREDVESIVWMRVCRYRASYDPANGSFLQWVAGIARTQVCEYWRRANPYALPGDALLATLAPDEGVCVDGQVASRDAFAQLLSLVDERSRLQLFLYYGRCMTLETIARRMGMNINTVRSNVSRARGKIARALEAMGSGEDDGGAHLRQPAS